MTIFNSSNSQGRALYLAIGQELIEMRNKSEEDSLQTLNQAAAKVAETFYKDTEHDCSTCPGPCPLVGVSSEAEAFEAILENYTSWSLVICKTSAKMPFLLSAFVQTAMQFSGALESESHGEEEMKETKG